MIKRRLHSLLIPILLLTFLLCSCTPAPRFRNKPAKSNTTQRHKGKKHPRKPPARNFKVGQTWTGESSWYGPKFHGRKTANGETYDMNGITAAHRELPFNTIIEVTYLASGKSCRVRINDRGPFKGNRMLDLSKGAAKKIGLMNDGVGVVRIRIISLGAE